METSIMSKRIAYFVGTYPSLTETFVQREIDYLRNHEVDVTVFAIRRPSDLHKSACRLEKAKSAIYARPDNILLGIALQFLYLVSRPVRYLKCIKLILKQVKYHPLPTVFRLFFHLLAAASFSHHLKKKQIRHIHAHFSTASTMALFCHYLSDVSYSMAAHASGDIYVNPLMLFEKMTCASAVIAESEYNRTYLHLVTDYRFEDKIEVVYNGVEVQNIFTYNSAQGEKIKLVSAGGLKYFKGFPTLIYALSLLRDAGYDFHCSIVGDGPQRKVLEKLSSRAGLTDRITLLGSLENPDALLIIAQADVFILASEIYLSGIRDGMPTVCLEAMSLGVPVISTFISGIPELIEDGKSGILIPEKNPKLLAQAIMSLIDDPAFRCELARNGYNRIKTRFNREATGARLLSILNDYLS